ncbi:hypothetical protein [Gordonia crocea]|uniref:YbaB/EbfC DNA-binding family protein n=1 Tax=Gordonia crocea TaxID=589162 RepID=A0A7I9UYI1_9ACTN|nr:hypothetical protein [Gordonia crocea]GED98013.1 hypothetical protein nbrc107697_20520 [Gordonia crocea]
MDEFEDLLRELQEAQDEVASTIQGLTTLDQWSRNPQIPRIGSDESGCVTVRLGSDDLPSEITILSDWLKKQVVLDSAITDAMTAAAAEAWKRASEALEVAGPGVQQPRVELEVPDAVPGASLSQTLEEVLAFAENADAEELSRSVTNRENTISITVGPIGMLDLSIDPDWAAQRSANELTSELERTFEEARPVVASLKSKIRQNRGEADNLLGRLFGVLGDLTNDTGKAQ